MIYRFHQTEKLTTVLKYTEQYLSSQYLIINCTEAEPSVYDYIETRVLRRQSRVVASLLGKAKQKNGSCL